MSIVGTGFSQKVRARVIELTGDDPGEFEITGFSPGPRWASMTDTERVDSLAQSFARRGEWLDESALKNHVIEF